MAKNDVNDISGDNSLLVERIGEITCNDASYTEHSGGLNVIVA